MPEADRKGGVIMKNNLMLVDPELSFDSIHQELNNFLRDTFMESAFSHPLNLRKTAVWRPAIELKQNSKEYRVKVQLPGVSKDDINVELNNDYMTISAEINEEKTIKDEEEKTNTCEFRYGKYIRTVSFDTPIKTNESTAEYKDGILKIIMPKQQVQQVKNKKLTIK